LLAENLSEEESKALQSRLHAAGLDTLAIPQTEIVVLPAPQPLAQFSPIIPEQILLVAAAGITVTSTTTRQVKEGPSAAQKILNAGILMTTGLPIKIGKQERIVEKTQQRSDLLFYLDIVDKDLA